MADEIDEYEDDFEEASDDEGRGGKLGRSMHAKPPSKPPTPPIAKIGDSPNAKVGDPIVQKARADDPHQVASTLSSDPPRTANSTSSTPRRRESDFASPGGPGGVSGGRRAAPRPDYPGPDDSRGFESRGSRQGSGGRRSGADSPTSFHRFNGEDAGTTAPRPVRARIGVGGSSSSQQTREHSSELKQSDASLPKRSSSDKPAWLQHDAEIDKALERQANAGSRPGSVAQVRDERRSVASRDRSSGRQNIGEELIDLDPQSGASLKDEQRKVKRLQQEVKRLGDRLKESELFSGQDDGLPTFLLDEVEMGRQISQGGFSVVMEATWRCTPCAIKKIFDPVITEELRADFENEVRMLRRLRHPNIVTLMAVCRVPPALSIMTEFIPGGTLYDLIHSPTSHRTIENSPEGPLAEVLPIILQAAAALAYLHATMIAHRDIKPHNVLLSGRDGKAHPSKSCSAKLCDFGLARMKSELCTGSMQWAGTAPYMAPELFQKKRYTEAVDIFAFGVMIWESVALDIPHANMEASDIAHRVMKEDGAGLQVSSSWPKVIRNLLKSTMAVDPGKRPPMIEVISSLNQALER